MFWNIFQPILVVIVGKLTPVFLNFIMKVRNQAKYLVSWGGGASLDALIAVKFTLPIATDV
jgi:hypothetical protein